MIPKPQRRPSFPHVPLALLEALEERFPDKLPGTTPEKLTDVAEKVGEQRVVRLLRREFEKQQNPRKGDIHT